MVKLVNTNLSKNGGRLDFQGSGYTDPFDDQLSNEKRAPGCLGFIGDEILPSYVGDYFRNH